ncbi:hypothetical protein [Wolbachia endosymbiont (group A) of Anomoia purmunda]|uniref:hypothetical protein n=1 Tax=Wolbachia endosymbiont (group A) of Anomoia purmunda TaxID=2953978 RepID=UPI00222FBB34|nr:hypothetical protein [Wolbachia endosymbiont (group A) of Anomoia purmunda]
MLPLTALLFIAAAPFFLIIAIWETKNINIALKYIIIAPLVVLCLLCVIPFLVLHLSISTLLAVAKITLFPEFFLSLWIKEGIKFGRVFSLSITQFSGDGLYTADLENFLEVKDSNKELLTELLKNGDLSIREVISCCVGHSRLIASVTTKIHDKEKSKIISDYLGLSDLKPLIQKEGYGRYHIHEIYNTHEKLARVVNAIDIELLKTLFKLDGFLLGRDPRYAHASHLSNFVDLFDNHDLVKNMSDAFRDKKMLAVQITKYIPVILCCSYDRYDGYHKKRIIQDNLRRLLLKKDLVEALPSDFSYQSSLFGAIKDFLHGKMSEEEFDSFASMLENKNVIDNLKHIDDLKDTFPPDESEFFRSRIGFLGCKEIYDSHVSASFLIEKLHPFLANNRLFCKLMDIPTEVLKNIFSTKLYENCANVDEVLAFFDCLDNKSKNKNILDNLIVAFEKDPEATHALLNSKMFNSRDKVLQMLSDKRFDGNKVREILNRINLWWTLQENDMVYKASYLNTTGKFSCVFNPQHIKFAFYAHTHDDVPHNESDQQKRAFLENVGLFQLLLETTIKARYESVFSIIKDTKFEHLADGRFISKVRDKINRYLSNLLIFKGNLFSDISNTFRLQIIDIVFSFNSQTKLHTTLKERWEKILKIKFTELFVAQKYQQITPESLAKIQDLTIQDLSAIPETEEIEEFLRKKGITNSDDLSLLTKLIEDGIHIVNVIGERVSLTQDITQTICDTFKDISVNHNTKQTPPSLLDLCKTNIIRSSLTEQISC